MNILQRQQQQKVAPMTWVEIEVELGRMSSSHIGYWSGAEQSAKNWDKYYALKVYQGETIKARVGTNGTCGAIAKVSENGTFISILAMAPTATDSAVDVTYTATEDMYVCIYNRNTTLATPTVTVTTRQCDWNDTDRYHT